MKTKIFAIALAAVLSAAFTTRAADCEQDERFMDMAVTVASRAADDGQTPLGAVAVVRGTWKATGQAVDGKAPEQDLADRAAARIKGATVYTVVQPIGSALDALTQAGVVEVVFAIPADRAVQLGLYDADAYGYEPDVAPMRRISSASAEALYAK